MRDEVSTGVHLRRGPERRLGAGGSRVWRTAYRSHNVPFWLCKMKAAVVPESGDLTTDQAEQREHLIIDAPGDAMR